MSADKMTNLLQRDNQSKLAVFVGCDADVLEQLDGALDDGTYRLEFVAMDDEPYATVVAMKPDLIVVSLALGDAAGFQLLSMLRLDARTVEIPVLSCLRESDVTVTSGTSVDLRLPSIRPQPSREQRH